MLNDSTFKLTALWRQRSKHHRPHIIQHLNCFAWRYTGEV